MPMTGTETNATYPRSDLLVESEWLALHLADPAVRIIDCDPPEVALARPHIPGAVLLPVHPYFRDTETGVGVATAPQAEQILGGIGVGNETRVICYDSQGGLLAARVWWVLWYYGHENAALLNGGILAWTQRGLPVTQDWAHPQAATFTATVHEERIASCDVLLPWVNASDFVPLDVRAASEWAGTTPNPANQQEGHIPSAVHIEWRDFVDWDQAARFKPASELREMLESRGVTRDKRVVPY
jgi:thiosulfate/3-mercaptopyruvate sulfurtransferase